MWYIKPHSIVKLHLPFNLAREDNNLTKDQKKASGDSLKKMDLILVSQLDLHGTWRLFCSKWVKKEMKPNYVRLHNITQK